MDSNPFAAFGLEPAPTLDGPALKEQFARATAESHPDKFQQAPEGERAEAEARYAELNRAYQTLTDPRQRLLALYELTKGEKPRDVQRIPPGTMDLFAEVGQTCQQADQLLERKRSAGRLERAGLVSAEMVLQDLMATLKGKLEKLAATLESELAALDTKWRAGEKDLGALEALYRKYSYLARWRQQLEEREIALMTGE
ncbi:MAG TPA: DnaJ domain-containing protein [Candidatus Methylacidiphilales bacterium]|nr:DnaJ domain-containing protein [Candidatus Methylacidiphilales bacterium]